MGLRVVLTLLVLLQVITNTLANSKEIKLPVRTRQFRVNPDGRVPSEDHHYHSDHPPVPSQVHHQRIDPEGAVEDHNHAHEASEEVLYTDYQLLRVHPGDPEQLKTVLELAQDSEDVTVWATHNQSRVADLLCGPQAIQRVRGVLNDAAIPFHVAIKDLQVLIDT